MTTRTEITNAATITIADEHRENFRQTCEFAAWFSQFQSDAGEFPLTWRATAEKNKTVESSRRNRQRLTVSVPATVVDANYAAHFGGVAVGDNASGKREIGKRGEISLSFRVAQAFGFGSEHDHRISGITDDVLDAEIHELRVEISDARGSALFYGDSEPGMQAHCFERLAALLRELELVRGERMRRTGDKRGRADGARMFADGAREFDIEKLNPYRYRGQDIPTPSFELRSSWEKGARAGYREAKQAARVTA